MANNERVPLANVLITDDLDRRPHRPPAYEFENRALTRLAEAMVDSPQTMLQKVVEAALDLCVADSAGVSILDPRSATGTFRWHAVTGQLSAEVGRQIPGNASPCRTVLNENKPLLFTYPERHFDYGAEIHLPIVEALLVPFEAKEKLEGTLWVISHSPSRQFDIEDRRVLTSLSRFVCAAFEIKMAAMAAEAQRKAVADEIRQTWDTSATALTRCSSDLRYLWVNPAYAKLVGLPADHIIGRPMADVMGPQVLELIRPRLERVLRGERVEYEEEVPFASGGFRFLHVVSTPWTNAAGRVDGWLSSVSDITELRQTTLRLQEREARLRLALDASRGGSWSWDAHSNRADWDDRFRELYGFTAERPPSRGAWLRRVYEEDRQWVLASLDEILRTKTRDSWDNTFRIVRPDGTVAWIESRGQAYRDSEGELIRLTGLDLDVTERRRAEEALRESKEREAFLLRLTDTLRPLGDPLAIQEVTTRMLGEYLHVNRCNCGDIEGSDFIVRRSYANGVAPWIPGGPVATFGQSLIKAHRRGEPVVVNDVRSDPRLNDSERETLLGYEIAAFAGVMLLKDGQWVAVLAVHSATPRAWTKTEVELMQDVAERIWEAVERARAQEALREREQRLSLALDASTAGVWTWNLFTNQTTWDRRLCEQYGFAPEVPQNFDNWISTVHEEDRPRVFAHLDEVFHQNEDNWNVMFRIVRPDGSVAWMHALGRAERAPDGKITRMTGINLDITERRRAEEALQARRDEERDRTLRLLLETAPLGILSIDDRGVIVTANHALENMFGWDPGDLIGQSVEQLLPPELRDRHVVHRARYFQAPQPRYMGGGLDLTGQRKDGSTFPIEISLNHVSTLAGGKAIAFVTDITTRKQAAEALRQSHDALEDRTGELERRTAQLSRLASELTLAEQNTREQLAKTLHDGLQQLLFIAKMGLDRLPENDVAGKDRAAILAEVQTSIEEAIFASRSLSMELFPPALHGAGLPTAVTWLSDWMKEKYGLVVVATVDPLANSDRRDVRTLVFESLRELLFNAVKHAKVDRVAVDLALGEDDTLCVTVTDQGVGFDPATLFLPGSQKAGVGLFSIRERLMLLHGRFDIESTPWRGTRFRIVVPRSDDRLARVNTSSPDIADELPAARKFAGERVRILIVDDNSAVRAGVRRMLLDRPEFQIVGEASDGLEAIDQSRALQPDAIVMDVSMPKMDGVEATRRIHKEFPFIQIYGLSSAEKTDSPHPIQGAGAAGYFVKGTDMNLLIESLLSITRYRADVFSNTDFA